MNENRTANVYVTKTNSAVESAPSHTEHNRITQQPRNCLTAPQKQGQLPTKRHKAQCEEAISLQPPKHAVHLAPH